MPWAFLNVDGTIKHVVHKPTPLMKIEAGERLVRYNPPEFDAETHDAVPVLPVANNAEEVSFTLTAKDAAIVGEALKKRLNAAVQDYLDAQAQTKGYDSIISAISYAGSAHPVYGPDGVAFRAWRDTCWDFTFQLYQDVQSGLRGMPTPAELLAELPRPRVTTTNKVSHNTGTNTKE